MGGVIHTVKLRNSKKGDRYATFVIEDKEGVVEVIAWPDTYRRHEAMIRSGEPVVIAGALEISAERCQIITEEVTPLAEDEQWRPREDDDIQPRERQGAGRPCSHHSIRFVIHGSAA